MEHRTKEEVMKVKPTYENVMRQHTCMGCGGSKDHGMLLCFPCHRRERRKDGGYSERTEELLAQANLLRVRP